MPTDISERIDSNGYSFDGDRPHHAGETRTFDPPDGWCSLDAELGEAPFALCFDSGGEG